MVVQVTPPGIANLGWRFWIIWACICFSFIPVTYLFYPETANRTLEDIDRFFASRPGIVVAWDKSAFFSFFFSFFLFFLYLYDGICPGGWSKHMLIIHIQLQPSFSDRRSTSAWTK